jgi:hypothetical protein
MKTYINKSTLVAAVATMAGMFVYKQFASAKVVKAISGGAA